MVDELLAARGIIINHESVRQWALKFGQVVGNQFRRRLPVAGDKRHMDEVVLTIASVKHWLWRAVDQHGMVLDILVQSRRDTATAHGGTLTVSSTPAETCFTFRKPLA